MGYYLGIDIGTSGAKTLVTNAKGKFWVKASPSTRCTSPSQAGPNKTQRIGGKA